VQGDWKITQPEIVRFILFLKQMYEKIKIVFETAENSSSTQINTK
jgi:hypothetical protein